MRWRLRGPSAVSARSVLGVLAVVLGAACATARRAESHDDARAGGGAATGVAHRDITDLYYTSKWDAASATSCADVSCDSPPAPKCLWPPLFRTLRTYMGPGVCAFGDCFYEFTETECAGACTGGACASPEGVKPRPQLRAGRESIR